MKCVFLDNPKYHIFCLNELTFKEIFHLIFKLLTIFCVVCMSLLVVIISKKIYINQSIETVFGEK